MGRKGRAVQIVAPQDNTFVLEDGALKTILGDEKLKGMKIYPLCVAGAFRKGKSFLLSLLIMFLESQKIDWLKVNEEIPRGFSWKGGPDTVTSGIWAWSEVFIVKNNLGEEIAVLLLDTQGAFDESATVSENATIFAYSTMISSVQIFNLSNNIQENDLQNLQIFSDYGKVALEKSEFGKKPFQTLIFLVRDWQWYDKYSYGAKGGKKFLDSKLSTKGKKGELIEVREDIRSCFESIKCFLMPYPGCKIANGRHAKQINDIAEPFCDCIRDLVKMLFSPREMEPKRIDGSFVTCDSFVGCMQAYMTLLQHEKMPSVETVLQASAQAQNNIALAAAFRLYKENMDVELKDQPYLEDSVLNNMHKVNLEKAIEYFRNEKKLGGEETSKEYESILQKDIKDEFQRYSQLNDSKNIFKILQTPLVSIVGMASSWLAPSLLGLAGAPALVCYAIFGISSLVLASWSRTKARSLMNKIFFWRQPQVSSTHDDTSDFTNYQYTMLAFALGAVVVCGFSNVAESLFRFISAVGIIVAVLYAYRSGFFHT